MTITKAEEEVVPLAKCIAQKSHKWIKSIDLETVSLQWIPSVKIDATYGAPSRLLSRAILLELAKLGYSHAKFGPIEHRDVGGAMATFVTLQFAWSSMDGRLPSIDSQVQRGKRKSAELIAIERVADCLLGRDISRLSEESHNA